VFNRIIPVVLAAVFSVLVAAPPVFAQTTARPPARETDMNGRPLPTDPAPRRGGRANAAPTAEQAKAAAEALLTATGTTCQIGETVLRGQVARNQNVYEVSCATGPGYILIGTTPPTAADCVLLAGQAEIDRARDPSADAGTQCQIEANKNVVGVIATYAAEAGVKCTVDQGSSVGKSSEGNIIYEAGCAGTDGYWVEKTPTGWKTTECQLVVSSNGKCRFTTAEEQAATVKAWLAGSAASGCDVTQARYMGGNTNGAFYEAKCAVGDGFIARVDAAKVVQQVYPCAEATRIGGGCTLTPVAAAAPAPAAATTPQE
jgi:hypothetical protein